MVKHVESLKKNSLKLNAASHNNASWCTDADGFLEHSPRGGSLYYKGPALQKTIPFLRASLLICILTNSISIFIYFSASFSSYLIINLHIIICMDPNYFF